MAKNTSFFHPDDPYADSLIFEQTLCSAGLKLINLSTGAKSIGYTTKYKALARLHGI